MLREGQTLRVFNTGVVRKLGSNIHKVTGSLVKLRDLFAAVYVCCKPGLLY